MSDEISTAKFSEILCIGLGVSGVCLGVQLKRKFGLTDVHFYDRNESHSGTWWANRYPGCACDIPALFYSFSFEQNPEWTQLLPSNKEMQVYLEGVVDKYNLRPSMTFRTECESAKWDSKRQLWTVYLRDLATGARFIHECRLLFSAVGVLVEPKYPTIPGQDTFEGPMIHTARWKDDVDLKDKDVIIVGNGCSASQAVPRIAPVTKTLTQFFHSPHWLIEMPNTKLGPRIRWVFRNVPLALRLARLIAFIYIENMWRLFPMTKSGARQRRAAEKQSTEFTLRLAPEKYHDILIPDYPIACKRRIFDADGAYLKSLHAPNLHLTKDPILEIVPRGVRTATKTYRADVIVLATGFQTNNGLGPLRIQGRDGEWLDDHWRKAGGPGAYNGTAVHGFPNFMMIYGPNSTTGHTSVIMASENMVNYALKIVEPVIRGRASEVEIKPTAETEYSDWIQHASKDKVWNAGCSNWYVSKPEGWNSTLYPRSQLHFTWRSVFPTWSDWSYKFTASGERRTSLLRVVLPLLLAACVIAALPLLSGSDWWVRFVEAASEFLHKGRAWIAI